MGKGKEMTTLKELKEKAVSKQQQKLMGLALAYKRGDVPDAEVSDTVRDLAKSMSTKELEKFAGTKHKGLPDKVDEAVAIDARTKTFRETMKRLNASKKKKEDAPKKMTSLEFGTTELRDRYASMTPGQGKVNEDGHTDVSSSERMCKTIVEDANAISNALSNMGDEGSLPTWWTNKLATSAKDLNSLNDYISNPSENKQ